MICSVSRWRLTKDTFLNGFISKNRKSILERMNFTLSPSLENFDEQNVQTVHELLSPKEDFVEYDLEEVHVLLIPEEGLVEHDLEAVHALLRVNFRKRIHSEGRTVNVSEISMINIIIKSKLFALICYLESTFS